MKWSKRIAQGFIPGDIVRRNRPESISNPGYAGAVRGGRASPRAGKTCHVARCIFVARSKNTCGSANRPAAAGRGRDPSLAIKPWAVLFDHFMLNHRNCSPLTAHRSLLTVYSLLFTDTPTI